MLSFIFKDSDFDSDVVLCLGTSFIPSPVAAKCLMIPEIFKEMIKYLESVDLSTLTRVCKRWNRIVTPVLYRHVCIHANQNSYLQLLKTMDPKIQIQSHIIQQKINQLVSVFSSFQRKHSIQVGQNCTRISCAQSRMISNKMKHRTLVVPHHLGPFSHRFKGSTYVSVPARTKQKYAEQFPMHQHQTCLLLYKNNDYTKWTVSQAMMYQTHGPFLRSLTLTDLYITDDILIPLLRKLSNLNFLKLLNCKKIGDESINAITNAASHSLTDLFLNNLPNVTDASLQYVSKNCPNLEILDITNTNQITDGGIRSVLIMCPFLHTLVSNRFQSSAGFSINKKIIPYIASYGISLRFLGIAGCAFNELDLQKMIDTCNVIQHWQLGWHQIGSRRLNGIKQTLQQWFRSKVVLWI